MLANCVSVIVWLELFKSVMMD